MATAVAACRPVMLLTTASPPREACPFLFFDAPSGFSPTSPTSSPPAFIRPSPATLAMALPLLPLDSLFKLSGAFFSAALSSVILWFCRQPPSPNRSCPGMITAQVYRLCHADMTVSSELARDPTQAPSKVFHDLYERHGSENPGSEMKDATDEADALRRAAECGNWGASQPSELFLKVSGNPPRWWLLVCIKPCLI